MVNVGLSVYQLNRWKCLSSKNSDRHSFLGFLIWLDQVNLSSNMNPRNLISFRNMGIWCLCKVKCRKVLSPRLLKSILWVLIVENLNPRIHLISFLIMGICCLCKVKCRKVLSPRLLKSIYTLSFNCRKFESTHFSPAPYAGHGPLNSAIQSWEVASFAVYQEIIGI